MHVMITLHIRIPKRATAPMVATAIAHPPEQSPHHEPHIVTRLDPRPGYTSDDVAGRVNRLQRTPLPLEVPAWFFDLERQNDAQELVLEAIRDAVRARQTTRA